MGQRTSQCDVAPLQQVGAPDLAPVVLGEVAVSEGFSAGVGQIVLFGLVQWPPSDSVYSVAALGKRSASEAARPSERDAISSAVSWGNTDRKAAMTMPW